MSDLYTWLKNEVANTWWRSLKNGEAQHCVWVGNTLSTLWMHTSCKQGIYNISGVKWTRFIITSSLPLKILRNWKNLFSFTEWNGNCATEVCIFPCGKIESLKGGKRLAYNTDISKHAALLCPFVFLCSGFIYVRPYFITAFLPSTLVMKARVKLSEMCGKRWRSSASVYKSYWSSVHY